MKKQGGITGKRSKNWTKICKKSQFIRIEYCVMRIAKRYLKKQKPKPAYGRKSQALSSKPEKTVFEKTKPICRAFNSRKRFVRKGLWEYDPTSGAKKQSQSKPISAAPMTICHSCPASGCGIDSSRNPESLTFMASASGLPLQLRSGQVLSISNGCGITRG